MKKQSKTTKKVFKDIKTLTIKRSQWARGNEGDMLLNIEGDRIGQRCCLGFYAQQCGIPRKDIEGIGAPDDVVSATYDIDLDCCTEKPFDWKTKLLTSDGSNSELCDKLISINDAREMDEEDREVLLIHHFKKMGVKVRFVK